MRNLNLDLAKVFFTLMIMTTHLFWLGFRNNYGYLAVEFFFFSTGYFMMASIVKNKDRDISSASFLRRKVAIFFPMFLAAELLAILFKSYADSVSVGITMDILAHNFVLSVNELLFFQMANYPCYYGLGVGWYFSAMIIGLALLYPLLKRFGDELSGSSFFIGILLVGIVYTKVGALGSPEILIYCFPAGLIRGLGDMFLGVFLFTCVNRIQNIQVTVFGKYVLGLLEATFLICCTWYILTSEDSSLQYLIIMMMWGLSLIILSGKSILHINKEKLSKYSSALGKISLLLLLNHYWVFQSVSVIFSGESREIMLAISLVLVIVFSAVCYALSLLFMWAYNRMMSAMVVSAE